MSWARFESGAPEAATFASRQLDRTHCVLVGSIRRDGTPRISCVEGCILEGELLLGMMRDSLKARDLLRDPRIVIRNADCDVTGGEGEWTLRGRVVVVTDEDTRTRFVASVASRTTWKDRPFHLFSVEIEEAALVVYDGEKSEQSVKLWPKGVEFTRPY